MLNKKNLYIGNDQVGTASSEEKTLKQNILNNKLVRHTKTKRRVSLLMVNLMYFNHIYWLLFNFLYIIRRRYLTIL